MKRIAIFCDGTWAEPNSPTPTNVYFLSQCVADSDGAIQQHHHYFPGVGVQTNVLSGGIWGEGLDLKVLEAYRWLCGAYQLGDDIFVFGFSRGAYTARSLVGLMRTCGVLSGANVERAAEAMEIYRQRGGGPDTQRARDFRARYAEASVDPALIAARREDQPSGESNPHMLRVRYLGIWDTVGALGVPELVPLSRHFMDKYRFHDCALSRHVEYARHAVAIDEYRTAFAPTLWSRESIAEINAIHREQRVEQDWFPGDHGSVGGGGEFRQLSNASLLWIAEGAERAGLKLKRTPDTELGKCVAGQDPVNGPLRNTRNDTLLLRLRGQGARADGPRVRADLSGSAVRRLYENRGYLTDAGQETGWRKQTLNVALRTMGLG